MISFQVSGDFKRTDMFLAKMSRGNLFRALDGFAREGVAALASATPVESGLTASSWTYKISTGRGSATISWLNTHINDGVPIAIILQYGHGTGTGGYVAGRDYINPAIRPVFDKIADSVWKEVTSA